ncbi:MAG: putative peptidoglycan glycosyltransferase FtsW [Chlamydiia bacterium]
MNKQGLALLIAISLIFSMGLLMVFNTTAAEVLDRALDKNIHHALIKQLLYAVVGSVFACVVWGLGYQTILKLSGPLLLFFTLLLGLVFVPGIGLQINGAHRWLNIFGNSFQPSEFVKYLIPLYYIHKVSVANQPFLLKDFLLLMGMLCIPLGLILVEPDNGTVVIILSTMIALFLLTRLPWAFWAFPLLVLVSIGGLAASQMSHVPDRIRIYLHPELDLQGKGHQPHQAKIAAGSGRFWGRGFGESVQKMNYLPEARSDYIAAIFAEEFGFLGMISLILLYIIVGFIGFSIAFQAPDKEGFYLASVITYLLCFQAFLNMGVVSGLLPSKGTNLPFFSQGGSSLLVNFMAMSILFNINKHNIQSSHG